MGSMVIIPDNSFNSCESHPTMGDETRPEASRSLLKGSTESDELRAAPTDSETLLYHNLDSSSDDRWSNEDLVHPFHFLDLPLEIQLEVVEILSESYESHDLSVSVQCWGHPLLKLRQ